MTWGNVSSAVGDRRATRGTRTVRVGRLDAAVTGAPVWVVIGPVRDDAGSRAGEVLDSNGGAGSAFPRRPAAIARRHAVELHRQTELERNADL